MLLYLIPLVGIIKSTHYCMGNVLDVAYFSFKAASCFCEKQESDVSDCCSNELEVYQIDSDQVRAYVDSGSYKLFAVQPLFQTLEYTMLINNNDKDSFVNTSIPPPRLVPVYIMTSNLQYYG